MRLNMKSVSVSLAAVAVFVVTATACNSPAPEAVGAHMTKDAVVYEADYPTFGSAEEAAKESQNVVLGTTVSSKTELLYPEIGNTGDPKTNPQPSMSVFEQNKFQEENAVVVTVSQFQVTRVIKGNIKAGQIISVRQPGGVWNGTEHQEKSTVLLEKLTVDPGEVLLSMDQYGDVYSPVSPTEGVLTVSADQIISTGGKSIGANIETFAKSIK